MDRLASLAALFLVACGGAAPPPSSPPFDVTLQVQTDDGDPLAGAAARFGDRTTAPTAGNGEVKAELTGEDGEEVRVVASCPSGFASPKELSPLRLTRTRLVGTNSVKPLTYRFACTRQIRDVVLVVRADHGEGLPVEVNGKPLGVTSHEGVDHVLVHVDRDAHGLTVSLDTRGRRDLRPQNPSRDFELDGRDAILIYEQPFSVSRTIRAPARARRLVPYRLN